MQTFLPYPNFLESAKVLDKKRCWKQVVEAKQIIDILTGMESDSFKELSKEYQLKQFRWMNHPAVKMWEGHIVCLENYFDHFLQVAILKHKINTKYIYILQGKLHWREYNNIENPWWLGNEDFHRAMRARLIEKKPEFYLPLWPEDKGFNNGKYLWPDMKTKTFRVI